LKVVEGLASDSSAAFPNTMEKVHEEEEERAHITRGESAVKVRRYCSCRQSRAAVMRAMRRAIRRRKHFWGLYVMPSHPRYTKRIRKRLCQKNGPFFLTTINREREHGKSSI